MRLSLKGADAHNFLEKLVTLVLPSQNAFEGLLVRSLDRLGHLHFRWGMPAACQMPAGMAKQAEVIHGF